MTEEYAELVAELRRYGVRKQLGVMREAHWTLFKRAADAIEQLDAHHREFVASVPEDFQ